MMRVLGTAPGRLLLMITGAFVLAALALVMFWPGQASGHGGGPPECSGPDVWEVNPGDGGGSETFEWTHTEVDGDLMIGVCIKTGVGHTEVLGDGDFQDGCFTVSGVNSSTLTVTRNFGGPECQGISHLDVVFEEGATIGGGAEGEGTHGPACSGANVLEVQGEGDADLEFVHTDVEGNIIIGVCFQAGSMHTGVLTDGTFFDGCFTVSGVGTSTITITRNFTGPDCQAISHVDIVFEEAVIVDEEVDGDDDEEAEGEGGHGEACSGANVLEVQGEGDADLEFVHTDVEGNIIVGVCFQAGSMHTGVLTDGTFFDGCFTVSGVGTSTITITRNFTGPDCQAISHVDIVFEEAVIVDEEVDGDAEEEAEADVEAEVEADADVQAEADASVEAQRAEIAAETRTAVAGEAKAPTAVAGAAAQPETLPAAGGDAGDSGGTDKLLLLAALVSMLGGGAFLKMAFRGLM